MQDIMLYLFDGSNDDICMSPIKFNNANESVEGNEKYKASLTMNSTM